MKNFKKSTLNYLYYFIIISALVSCKEDDVEEELTPEINLQNIDVQYLGAGAAQNCKSGDFRFKYTLSYTSNVNLDDYVVILVFDNVYENGDGGKFATDKLQIVSTSSIEYANCIDFQSDTYLDSTLQLILAESLSDEEPLAESNPMVARIDKP